jgi:hypothetical protein
MYMLPKLRVTSLSDYAWKGLTKLTENSLLKLGSTDTYETVSSTSKGCYVLLPNYVGSPFDEGLYPF